MATPFPTAPCPAPIPPRAPISPAAPAATAIAKYSEEGAVYQDNMQRLLRKFETAKILVPAPVDHAGQGKDPLRRDLFRLDRAGDERGAGGAGGRRPASGHDAAARLSLLRRGERISSTPMTRSSWSSRIATPRCACCWSMNAASIRRASSPSCNYDGTPITARFIIDGHRRAHDASSPRRPRNDLYRQAQAAPSRHSGEQAGLHPSRL